MDVQVVDALASLNAVVDDDPEPLVQLLLLRDLLRGVQEVAEELFVTLLRLAELRQAAANLGMTKKWVFAWGAMSRNARHRLSS